MTDHLLIEKNGSIATLTMNRPDSRNALSLEMRAKLNEAVIDLEADDSIRCVVIKGAGEHFMAGGDVKSFKDFVELDPDNRRKTFEARIHNLTPTLVALRRMKKPVIASVQGAAAGFGLSLAMACDIVIAGESSFYTMGYIGIGATPDGSGSYSLPRIVGLKKAMEIAMLGDRFGAEAAKEYGLINFIVPDDELEAETKKLAERLASGPTFALGKTKELMHASMVNGLEQQLALEAESFSQCAATEDWAEAIVAFSEKRKPSFKGK
ncbi:enoyl-CoA hydratase [Sneathiella sp. P13V-1]|uniref:enoyl-CoA hydratase/isomerase family protein n=1 Tax=Sneathiella sp. P13V-1 TaxID=2697366 RepID=UPI00187B6FCA|nr:enoyl-CoA hydratase [Sneathiella sp. P13V-1]MBE7638300.1 enoyl-CoA hydratase [Sneathiella sp. P13V-1]